MQQFPDSLQYFLSQILQDTELAGLSHLGSVVQIWQCVCQHLKYSMHCLLLGSTYNTP